MKPYHELHITYLGNEAMVKGWTNSAIDGDIVLGAGMKRYLTRHEPDSAPQVVMINEMEKLAESLSVSGRKVLRTKIERVLYDYRTQ